MDNAGEFQDRLDSLEAKLDRILAEVEQQRRHRQEMQDLQDDLLRVARDVYHVSVRELENIHDEVSTGDIAYLFRKLLRNINNLTAAFEQLESVRGFIEDFSPVARQFSHDVMRKLHDAEEKGYFDGLRELLRIVETVVTTYDSAQVRKLGDNIVTILDTVRNLTQPEMMHGINNAVNVYRKLDITITDDKSLFALLREMNTPEARRGLAFTIEFLKNLPRVVPEADTDTQPGMSNQQEH